MYTVKNEVCKAHQIVSIHTLLGKKCAYRDILVCMAHFSIYSVASGVDRHLDMTFGLHVVDSSFLVSVLFREAFGHP